MARIVGTLKCKEKILKYISIKSGILTLLSVWLIYPAIWGLHWACAPSQMDNIGPLPFVSQHAIRCAILVEHYVPSLLGTVLIVGIFRFIKSESTRVFIFHFLTVVAFLFTIIMMFLVH